jgi:hypothetical protein
MKRVLMVLALVIAAGAGAYGQSKLKAEPPSIYPIQAGIAYQASFCGGTAARFGASFDMRVTKQLADGWLEVEVGTLRKDIGEFYEDSPFTARINQARLCYVKPIVP